MKKCFSITALLLAAYIYSDSQNDPQKLGTINLYYVCTQTNTNNAPQTSTIFATPFSHKHTGSLLRELRSLSWAHKGKLLLGSAVSSYSALLTNLLFTMHAQHKQLGWASWKQAVPLEVLTQMPKEVVATELITTIYEKENNKAATAPLNMLYTALLEINYELRSLQKAVRFYRFVETTRLTKILPYNPEDHADALDKINRLAYLKNILEHLEITPVQSTSAA